MLAIFLIREPASAGNTTDESAAHVPDEHYDSLRLLSSDINLTKSYAVKVPAKVEFAGEQVPLSDFEVRERLQRELTINAYWHSSTIQNIQLAHRWFPVIEKKLKANGIPDDFKYLAMAESGLRNVSSPANAEGIWQFLSGTAEHYGLVVNSEVDQRYDVEKATDAAISYFKEAYDKFHNWTLVAASYNAGMNYMESALHFQKQDDYYNLYLKDETSRYLFRVIAFKLLYENTESFGFIIDDNDLYDPLQYRTVQIDTSVSNLADFAIANGTNYKMLKYYNPWLRSTTLTLKKGQEFDIRLPKNKPSSAAG